MSKFNGPEYQTDKDHERLSHQHDRVRDAMLDQQWRTYSEIASITGDPENSISAQLRHLRKPRFGSWLVERRPRGNRDGGLFEYRLLAPPPGAPPPPAKETLKEKALRLQTENDHLKRVIQRLGDYIEELEGKKP